MSLKNKLFCSACGVNSKNSNCSKDAILWSDVMEAKRRLKEIMCGYNWCTTQNDLMNKKCVNCETIDKVFG